MFSFKKGDERETRRLECNGPAMPEKDYVFCKRSNPEFVELKIERPGERRLRVGRYRSPLTQPSPTRGEGTLVHQSARNSHSSFEMRSSLK